MGVCLLQPPLQGGAVEGDRPVPYYSTPLQGGGAVVGKPPREIHFKMRLAHRYNSLLYCESGLTCTTAAPPRRPRPIEINLGELVSTGSGIQGKGGCSADQA